MIRPSYIELMDIANEGSPEEKPVVNSRYSIVIAAAKRARQLIDNAEPLLEDENTEGEKALSIAVKELSEGRVRILPDEDESLAFPDAIAEDFGEEELGVVVLADPTGKDGSDASAEAESSEEAEISQTAAEEPAVDDAPAAEE